MARVVWTTGAQRDLAAARRYIQRDSRRFAAQFTARVTDATRRLGTFPASGRVLPELGRGDVREILVGRYRIIYELPSETVRILMVWHAARLLSHDELARRL